MPMFPASLRVGIAKPSLNAKQSLIERSWDFERATWMFLRRKALVVLPIKKRR